MRKTRRALAACALFWAALLAVPALTRAQAPCAQDMFHCQRHHCPPHLKHCTEGPPRICYKHGCPRPICNPCLNPNWGYFETCWNPWPWPPDFSHCRAVPPAATVVLNPDAAPFGVGPVYGTPVPGPGPGNGAINGAHPSPDTPLPQPRPVRPGNYNK